MTLISSVAEGSAAPTSEHAPSAPSGEPRADHAPRVPGHDVVSRDAGDQPFPTHSADTHMVADEDVPSSWESRSHGFHGSSDEVASRTSDAAESGSSRAMDVCRASDAPGTLACSATAACLASHHAAVCPSLLRLPSTGDTIPAYEVSDAAGSPRVTHKRPRDTHSPLDVAHLPAEDPSSDPPHTRSRASSLTSSPAMPRRSSMRVAPGTPARHAGESVTAIDVDVMPANVAGDMSPQ